MSRYRRGCLKGVALCLKKGGTVKKVSILDAMEQIGKEQGIKIGLKQGTEIGLKKGAENVLTVLRVASPEDQQRLIQCPLEKQKDLIAELAQKYNCAIR